MVEANYAKTVSCVKADFQTGQIHLPASVERNQDLSIDDDVRVVVKDIGTYVDSASFTATVTGASKITVPAEFVRETGLELGETYMMGFEAIETQTVSESQEEPENLGELFNTATGEPVDSDDGEDDETESLAELFE